MAWLPESLNKHRAPSPEEIRANQGWQNPLSSSCKESKDQTRLGEVLGSHSRSTCAFREAGIVFQIDLPFKAARQKRQKGLFREM